MSQPISKGMILAAGLGTRLQPITHKVPKPLVPVLNIPNILYSVDLLARAGVRDIVVNVHHLREQLIRFLGDGAKWGVRLSFSQEEILLGTGGGVKKAEAHFDSQPFVLTNSDFITDGDLSEFLTQHFERRSLATMLLLDDPRLAPFYSKVGVDSASRLCSLPILTTRAPDRAGIFTGVHLLDASTLQHLQPVPSGINQILYPALMRDQPDRVFGSFLRRGYWLDTGDLHFLWDTSMRLLERLTEKDAWLQGVLSRYGGYQEIEPGLWSADGVRPATSFKWTGPVVLGRGCAIDRDAHIGPFTVVGNASQVGSGARLTRSVLLPGAFVPAGESLSGVLRFEGQSLPTKKNSAGE
jgi:NDP-sugar pyrophosphorylase family protein